MGSTINIDALRVNAEEFEKLLDGIAGKHGLSVATVHGSPIADFLNERGAKIIKMLHNNYSDRIHTGFTLPDSSMDLVISDSLVSSINPGNQYMENPEGFFRETLRVLGPGGHYLSNDFTVKPSDLVKAGFVDVRKAICDIFLYGRKPNDK